MQTISMALWNSLVYGRILSIVFLLYLASAAPTLRLWAETEGLILPEGQGGFLGFAPPAWWVFVYKPVIWWIAYFRDSILVEPFHFFRVFFLLQEEILRSIGYQNL